MPFYIEGTGGNYYVHSYDSRESKDTHLSKLRELGIDSEEDIFRLVERAGSSLLVRDANLQYVLPTRGLAVSGFWE